MIQISLIFILLKKNCSCLVHTDPYSLLHKEHWYQQAKQFTWKASESVDYGACTKNGQQEEQHGGPNTHPKNQKVEKIGSIQQ